MTAMIGKQPLRSILQWTWRALLCGGLATLVYCGFIVWDARVFQDRQTRLLDGLTSLPAPAVPVNVTPGGLIGRIEIPRLGLSNIVMEGSDARILRRAVGHVPGTALPGQSGNVAITAHRDTFFRPLRNIRRDDVIRLTTLRGEYVYRVVSTRIVAPEDVSVLDSTGDEALTLITCYPFYFVGAAPRRFIVHAELFR
jgi:sortase A